MENFGEKVAFIWSVADLLRDAFKRSKYPDVILPLTVLRRLDCVLEPTKDKVLEVYARLKNKLKYLAPQLRKASGFAFYNTSPFTFERLLAVRAVQPMGEGGGVKPPRLHDRGSRRCLHLLVQ